MGTVGGKVRGAALVVAVAPPIVMHLALTIGYGARVALFAAAAQVVAAGALLRPVIGALAPVLTALLLAGLAVGAMRSAATGLLVAFGCAHAVLYAALLAVFGASLRQDRIAVVTRLAWGINPHFHTGMVPYTRAVTLAWCLFAAGQLALSAALLLFAPIGWWLLLVGTLHAPMALGLAAAEFAVRCWRFPGEHTSFGAMVRGVRGGLTPAQPDAPSGHRSGRTPR